ncbi:MAG: S41 family peptidase [SAR202 cluster bacterium]|nr:S41 family peptidase [SAR202 cluster bacterium]|tara:strand:+ start:15692 stop:16996 length:1305 start_codon:yes stop_codon:yes gene_type:complete
MNGLMKLNISKNKYILTTAVVLILLLTALTRTDIYSVGQETPDSVMTLATEWSSASGAIQDPQDSIIIEVWEILSDNFVDKETLNPESISKAGLDALFSTIATDKSYDPSTLSYITIDAMLEEIGDPHTFLFRPDAYSLYSQNTQGEFDGIGARVELSDSKLTIVEPIQGTPAFKAGIEAGDVILAVNGESTLGWSLLESVTRIRGPKGTSVNLLIQRVGVSEPFELEITRSSINEESVTMNIIDEDFAYIRISCFCDDTDEELENILTLASNENPAGVILDLRNNLGGLLSTTVNIADVFLGEQIVLYAIDSDGKRTDYFTKSDSQIDLPMVVLVNEFSASASEVLSGALQDHGRAKIIGTKTFGKGSVNLPKKLSDESALYYSIARWYSPDGNMIEGKGIKPDFTVEAIQGKDPEKDSQLEMALNRLKSIIN